MLTTLNDVVMLERSAILISCVNQGEGEGAEVEEGCRVLGIFGFWKWEREGEELAAGLGEEESSSNG